MRLWKAAGLAGFVGIAATGAVLARAERRRRAYTPDEIRARLHERLAQSAVAQSTADQSTADRSAATESAAGPQAADDAGDHTF